MLTALAVCFRDHGLLDLLPSPARTSATTTRLPTMCYTPTPPSGCPLPGFKPRETPANARSGSAATVFPLLAQF